MAIGVAAAVLFFVSLVFLAILMILLGLAGVIGFGVARKKGILGKTKTLIGVSVGILLAGLLLFSVPLGYFSFIFIVNATPPEDYVETGIDIEVIDDEYESYTFVADGTVYTVLDLASANISTEHPVFSHKAEGILNRAQWCNYYEVKNGGSFHIVCDEGGALFAPQEEHDQIYAYYEGAAAIWYAERWGEDEKPFPIENITLQEKLENLQSQQDTLSYKEYTFAEDQQYEALWCNKESADGVVLYECLSFVLIDGSAYLTGWESWNDGHYTISAYKTDEELSALLAVHCS